MRTLTEEDEDAGSFSTSLENSAVQQPPWMRLLMQNCENWLSVLPTVSASFHLSEHKAKIDFRVVHTLSVQGQKMTLCIGFSRENRQLVRSCYAKFEGNSR
jgi:hypothetical protein